MGLTMKERKKAIVVAPRYQRAKKKEKGMILNEFIKLTGYNRSYAAHVLQIHGRKFYIDSKTVMVGDIRKKAQRKRQANAKGDINHIWNRFFHEATYIISSRFLREATGIFYADL